MTTLLSRTAPNYKSLTGTEPSIHVPQPFLNYGGLTKMLSGDYKYIPKESTLTQEQLAELERQRIEEEKRAQEEQNAQKAQKEGEEDTIGFWIKNINTGDVYRSFLKPPNPWARSSGFTQELRYTRGAFQYYQNAHDSPIDLGLPKEESEEDKKAKEEAERKARELEERIRGSQIGLGGIREDTRKKIIGGCVKKGWIGLRNLKVFLHESTKDHSDIIDKNSFKYLLKRKGILLEDVDIESICDAYDPEHTDYFNFVQLFNALRTVSPTRGAQIDQFMEQVKAPGQGYIPLQGLMRLADMNFHPEVLKFVKNTFDVKREYEQNWDSPKEEGKLSEDEFRQFFYDVSTCVEKDNDFTQILKTLGYK